MNTFWQHTHPRMRAALHRLSSTTIDALTLVASLPFVLLGLLAGLVVSLTIWIIAAIMIGYVTGRNRNA